MTAPLVADCWLQDAADDDEEEEEEEEPAPKKTRKPAAPKAKKPASDNKKAAETKADDKPRSRTSRNSNRLVVSASGARLAVLTVFFCEYRE